MQSSELAQHLENYLEATKVDLSEIKFMKPNINFTKSERIAIVSFQRLSAFMTAVTIGNP